MGDKLPTPLIRNLGFGTLGEKSPATPHFYVIYVRIEAYIEGIMDPPANVMGPDRNISISSHIAATRGNKVAAVGSKSHSQAPLPCVVVGRSFLVLGGIRC